jgi:FkbM family methyltransferase
METKFSVHHVGGRAGSRGFPIVEGFESSVVSVLYDADTDCIEQIQADNAKLESKCYVLPFCLGEKVEEGCLYITHDPYASSTFIPNPPVMFYNYTPKFDYSIQSSFKVVKEISVNVTTLDRILTDNIEILPPDFLSIDTQGSELAILKGSPIALRNVVGVLVEVEFIEFYKAQPLFADVHSYLVEAGFELYSIEYPDQFTTRRRGPVGSRGNGQMVWGDALYFRRPSETNREKLAVAALAFGFAELAVECLITEDGEAVPVNGTILSEFQKILLQDKRNLPTLWTNIFDVKKSMARFDGIAAKRESNTDVAKELLKKILPSGVIYFIQMCRKILSERKRTKLLYSSQLPYRKFAQKFGFNIYLKAMDKRLVFYK